MVITFVEGAPILPGWEALSKYGSSIAATARVSGGALDVVTAA